MVTRRGSMRQGTQARAALPCHDGMLVVTTNPPSPPVPGSHAAPHLVDDDGDRISVTDVNGTVARFEMTYEPPSAGETLKFGPPMRSRVPSAIYLAAAAVFALVTFYAYNAPTQSSLFSWAVEGDRIRPLPLSVIAVVLIVSSAATVLRTHMRGVLVSEDWIEARYLLPLGIPRARRWGWAQVTRLVVDGATAGLELYDGTFERLPPVAEGTRMVQLLMHHAGRFRIHVTLLERATPR
jgi:hypothetical protein